MASSAVRQPILIYDGDCGFCRYWVRYWARLTGPGLAYAAYQNVAADYPEIAAEEFARSIQLFEADGQRHSGADAAFRVLARVPHKRFWRWAYQRLPGFAALAEHGYGLIARHRVAAARISQWLWGKELYPDEYHLVSWTFLRVLAPIYFAAFASLAVQINGLAGSNGILPFVEYLEEARRALGATAWWHIPTIFWFDASDAALFGACLAGMAAAVAAMLNVFLRTALLLCYGLYLSLVYAGQVFLEFQWDMFLLESGFLALFLPGGSRIVIWLYRWLLFRFMFMGGVVKLASGDPAWRDLSALRYHFETQPLPSPVAWYADLLPDAVLRLATASVLVIEIWLPFFVFLPRNPRLLAGASFLVLQGMILLTGNYNFFNLLTVALCLFLLEDRDLRTLLGAKLSARIRAMARSPSRLATASTGLMAIITLSVCGALLWVTNTRQPPVQPFSALLQLTGTLGIVNGYGPFAVMTTERREIIVEGSDDAGIWLPYEFKYKPGDPTKPLGWNIPHQPRLDWQMWFAALGDARHSLWFARFLEKLREGSKPVLALLERTPFPGHPPKYLRATLFRYRFATPEMRSASGRIWRREYLGIYWPAR